MMITIDNNNKICTLINVFTVEPEKLTELLENLREMTVNFMSKYPGFISANLHVGNDMKTIINYAQWASMEDYQNVLKDEEALKHMKGAAALATGFKPTVCSEIWSHSA
ncbi:antibiotic biosynthesis monooxygenase family protein [Pseudomonas shirazensis]